MKNSLSFVQFNITQSATITLILSRPIPEPIVKKNGKKLNSPALPETFMINFIAKALYKVLLSTPFSLYLFAYLYLNEIKIQLKILNLKVILTKKPEIKTR